jgi:hypothetical protein
MGKRPRDPPDTEAVRLAHRSRREERFITAGRYTVASAHQVTRATAGTRAGGSRRGGRARHRPHCWTGYPVERLRSCGRYVGWLSGCLDPLVGRRALIGGRRAPCGRPR